jgi:8-oxo-dGTP pyrophosphatase MutT (NUDIX family)
MRYDEARRLLRDLPERLPALPPELVPVALGTANGTAPRFPSFPDERRAAAVLILIHPDHAGEACLVLTERSPGEHRHAGQISLPGGQVDDNESIEDAALREAYEEVGLDAAAEDVYVHGVLPEVDVRVSGFLVHPVIAFADHAPRLMPDGYEVASIIRAPLEAFLPGSPIEVVTAERDGFSLRYGGFRIGEYHVWGATAGILGRLGVWLGQVRSGTRSSSGA